MTPPSLCPPPPTHPYAYVAYDPEAPLHDHHTMVTLGLSLQAATFITCRFQSLLLYAQDKDNRDVVITIVKNGSDEHKIYQLLLGCPALLQSNHFPSVIPVLQIFPSPHDFSFVVLPRYLLPISKPAQAFQSRCRWGDTPRLPEFRQRR
jgi:hypothetical protein